MSRPQKNDTEKKTIRRSVVFTEAEYRTIQEKVKLSGMALSPYLLSCGLNKKIVAPIPKFDRLSLAQLAGIGNNLNQIAKRVNSAGLEDSEIGSILKENLQLAQLLRDILHQNAPK